MDLSSASQSIIPTASSQSDGRTDATDEEKSAKKKKKKKDKKKKKKNKEKKKKIEAEKYEWVEKTKESCVTKVKNNNGEKVKITEKKEHIVRHIPNANVNVNANANVVVADSKTGQAADVIGEGEKSKKTMSDKKLSASASASSSSSSPVKKQHTNPPSSHNKPSLPTKSIKSTSSPTKPSSSPTKPSSSPTKPSSSTKPFSPPQPSSKKTPDRVPIKIWDQPMFKNSCNSKDEEVSASKKTSTSTTASVENKDSVWDFLNKNRGIQGFGGKSVQGWGDESGTGSKMESGRNAMDDLVDSEDEEMDRGKVKKVKKKNNPTFGAFGLKSSNYNNPFQKQYENTSKKFS